MSKQNIITNWVYCPVCGNKTRLQLRADTELKKFPLYCPKCRQESLIDANKHYDAGLIEDVVDGVVSGDLEIENYPCEGTMDH